MYSSNYEMATTHQKPKHHKCITLHSKKNTRSCPNATSIPKRRVKTRSAKNNKKESPSYGTDIKKKNYYPCKVSEQLNNQTHHSSIFLFAKGSRSYINRCMPLMLISYFAGWTY